MALLIYLLQEHDLAEFLKGTQRDSCQHVRVRHGRLQDVQEEQEHVDSTAEKLELVTTTTKSRDSPDIGALLQRLSSARPHIPRSKSSLAQYSNPSPLSLENLNRRAHSSLDKPRSV